jgi:hypothetical protein
LTRQPTGGIRGTDAPVLFSKDCTHLSAQLRSQFGVTARQVQHAPRIAHARYHGTHIEVEFRAECTLDQNSR